MDMAQAGYAVGCGQTPIACIPSGLIWGSNFSEVTALRSSGLRLQTLTPSAAPAAMAAPRAVVSGMEGFTATRKWGGRRSALMPPFTAETKEVLLCGVGVTG